MNKQVRVWMWHDGKKRFIYGNLIGIFQYAEPYTPMKIGQTAGQIAHPVAVIETVEKGFIKVKVEEVENVKRKDEETKIIKSSNHVEED